MNFKKFSIGNKLFISFAAVLVAIVLLGTIAYNQSVTLFEQTNQLYNHPLIVRRAIADVESGVLRMRVSIRDLMIASTPAEQKKAIAEGLRAEQMVERNFKLVYERYLGPRSDVDDAYEAFRIWNNAREDNTKLVLKGDISLVKYNISHEALVGQIRNEMLAKIQKISDFARNKSIQFYVNSEQTANFMRWELLIICGLIVVFSVLVAFYLVRSIRNPLKELGTVIAGYRAGNIDLRSKNTNEDEIGLLASTFNDLLDNVKTEKIISDKMSAIADAMLIEDNSHSFFKALLPVLITETSSQIAAVYLLNDNKTEFYLYESIGLSAEHQNHRFSATAFEGEFGTALATKKMQFIKSIPLNTVFSYNAVSGAMVPREIVTIPILVGNEVVAVLSLAALRNYTVDILDLFYKIYDVLSARIDGILAYREMRKTAQLLRTQNIELEQQRSELNQQSAELTHQNAELEIQKNHLKEASRLKTTFLSNMSHELRTPLNSVIALSGVLNRRLANKIPKDEYSYIGVIERNGKHLLTLINDILDISRIEAGREEVEINEFAVNDAVAEVVEMIQPQAVERKIRLVQLPAPENIMLQSDAKKVRHILQNLIANAVKFTEKGSVEVKVESFDNKLIISVKDTGIGISPDHLHHIFDEFRQADGSTSRRFGGTGLGLSIARKYARLLGGDITVISKPDVGSEFTVVLPLKVESKVKIQPVETNFEIPLKTEYRENYQPAVSNDGTNKAPTILLVEDSEPAIIQIKDMLESNRYVVHAARSGAEALQILTEMTPDAMILDLQMPQMDGFELLEKIRNFEKTKSVPVLILTAKHITKEDIKFLKNNNIHQLIQKGDVQRQALLQAVYNMVAKPVSSPKDSKPETPNLKPETPNPKSETRNPKHTVLIVEDNPDNMTTVKAVLADKYIVHEAVNGLQAVEVAGEQVPDLILMDIALPEIDGIEAFKKIRNNLRLQHIPIIALTASAMLSDRETILAHGFEAYIPKPIDEKQFFEILNKVMYGK